jgi:metal-responsive CopG/Arc/MetJ family transcriptional regulator
MAADRITIRVDKTLRKELERLARASGTSESDVVREALEKHIKPDRNGPTCYDLAKRAKLIGAAAKLPKDLSTNRSHFNGLGKA